MTTPLTTIKLFNTDALLSSGFEPFLPDIQDAHLSFLQNLSLDESAIAGPKKRGRKKKIVSTKDNFAPTITIKEIIENDKVGAPMEAEKLLNQQKSKMMRLRRQNNEIKPIDLAPQQSYSSTSTGNQAEETAFLGQPSLKMIDGKIVLEENLLPPPSIKDKLQDLSVTKSKALNSMSFRTKTQSKKWTEEEDRKFYKLLEMFGPDFSMIALVFGTRDRNQIKNKFTREDHKNREKIDQALGRNKKYIKALEGRFAAKTHALPDARETQLQLTNAEDVESELGPITSLRCTNSTSSVDSVEMDLFRKINLILDKNPSQFTKEVEIDLTLPSLTSMKSQKITIKEFESNTSSELQRQNFIPTQTVIDVTEDDRVHQFESEILTSKSLEPKNLFFN